MKFRTAYSEKDRDYSIGGFPVTKPEYRMEFDEELGQDVLVVAGSENFVAKIQEAAKDCNIYTQIDRMNRTGDTSILSDAVEGFIDTLTMPKSLMEMENIRSQSSQLWASMPHDFRERYGQNINLFMKDVDKMLKQRATAKLDAARNAVKSEVKDE